MTKTELRETIAEGENSGVEFKSDVIDNHALARELVALANLQGGCLLLGVDDDGSVRGLSRDDSTTQPEREETARRNLPKTGRVGHADVP